jgi:hypothetical protein
MSKSSGIWTSGPDWSRQKNKLVIQMDVYEIKYSLFLFFFLSIKYFLICVCVCGFLNSFFFLQFIFSF